MDCSSPWTSLSTGCYRFITNPIDWPTAKIQCNNRKLDNRNAYLAEIGSEEEQNEIVAVIKGFPFKRWGYWIGLSDRAREKSMVWEHSGQTPNFTSWRNGQPDNYLSNQDCVALFQGGLTGGDGSWDDDVCSRTTNGQYSMGAICELKMGLPTGK